MTSLPRYTAYAKIVTESGREAGVWKGTVRTLELTDVAADAAEKARAAIEANMSAYTKPREQIREEIEKRQARWRQRAGAEAPPVRIEEKKPAASSEQRTSRQEEEPPPISFPSRKTSEAQESVKPTTADSPKEPEEKNLIYRSNFYLPDDKWTEMETTYTRSFRQDGYFHIELKKSCIIPHYIKTSMPDFRVYVDAERLKGTAARYGVCFRCIKESNGPSYYLFVIDGQRYILHLFNNDDYEPLFYYRSSEFIRPDGINSLMVQMAGREITLGANGHILATVTDNRLTSGKVGIFVSKDKDSLAEVRFRDFRLYSLEQ